MRKWSFAALLFTAFSLLAWGQAKPGSDEARVVEAARKVEQRPLDKDVIKEREWAVRWVIEAKDVHVVVCPQMMPWTEGGKKYKYSGDLMAAHILGMAAYAIEHPGHNDDAAQFLAGVESALKTYEAIVEKKSDAKLPVLEPWIAKRSNQELAEHVKTLTPKCK